MSLVIEDGSGVANANSYVSVADAADFFTVRGMEPPEAAVLIQAMDYLETLAYFGKPTNPLQPLQFPRVSIVDLNKNPYEETQIPKAVVLAQLWLSYYILNGFNPANVARQAVKREKVDVLETEFFGSGTNNSAPLVFYTIADLPNVLNPLKHLLLDDDGDLTSDGTGFSNGRVSRA